MEILRGIPVSPGIYIGKAFLLVGEDARIPERTVTPAQVAQEALRFEKAGDKVVQELSHLHAATEAQLGRNLAAILSVQVQLAKDAGLRQRILSRIRGQRSTAEFAVSRTLRDLAKLMSASDSQMFRQRASDILDLEQRLLRELRGGTHELADLKEAVALIAHDLGPSQTASLDRNRIKAFAIDVGGRTSHTAILASALELPAVVGLETISGGVVGGETVIIDGNRGIVIVAPDERTLARYRRLQKELEVQEALVFRDRNLPAVTRDGREIRVLANIEFPEEIASVLAHGAQGVGLFRTEFLYLRNGVMPTEADHFEAYRRSLQELKGLPLTVRTLDLGADKVFPGEWHKEANPFLGLRSIRLSIRRPENFRVQVRAILRASALGPVRLLLPLISCLEELRWAQGIIEEVKRELTAARVGFAPEIPVGIMIEVPSAALMAQTLAQECDFLSIGTNDLVQYTVAVDRGNEHVAHLYTPAHPAVLKLIHSIIEAGRKADLAVGMCGEMAGDPLYVASLIGFGLTEFSVAPAMVPKVKTIVRNVDAKQAEQDAAALLGLEDSTAVLDHLRSAPRDHPSSAGTTG